MTGSTTEQTPLPVVDVHAHVVVPAVEQLVAHEPGLAAQRHLDARRNGAESTAVSAVMVQERGSLLVRTDERVELMDGQGVDVQVLAPSPAQYHYWAAEPLALDLARRLHDGVATAVQATPERLTGLGVVPLQHPHLAVAALRDALAHGLRGVEISSHAPDPRGGTVELSDPRLEDFWAEAAARRAVVFVHPFGCTLDERLDRWYLSNTVGQPVETAVALSHLVFAGVLDRHPDLRVLAAHGGGYLPTYLGRSDRAWKVRSDARTCVRPPSTYLRELWFDSVVHDSRALRSLVDAAGVDRVCLGSDFPFDMGSDDPVGDLRASVLTADETSAIERINAHHLGLMPGLAT
ncbi:amidohydrolase family protein [Cellulomonas fimi]|uniref:Amidohydrolase 2 n=1 Tax=Cellulomonas fimi (strain ATCC 484 / DSM 20113 / JCM 1341 / CCUG 24087 / LMG 16345 / NBRC 15513 / NCIMB 8980 / NCTC 7547 / NRS-133) TaxID=590998 RepID=F4GYK1_CELFA|nr:amidohydrolase family protein [Cellulomonas fimi]AEE47118.1 amidohydrolase 2 [Cellulomonas fimi ATCC 484]NNH05610.1 amidohydrolase [Cellulomonas fimi]VEH35306.1 Predicted metal-dependent hydrolase of the TIM-barrel fold [Cellulomonas fimi]